NDRLQNSAFWPLGSLLFLFSCLFLFTPCCGRRLICWQAIMNCQAEPECNYAYEHYTRACGPVLNGERRNCPSHCISSLVQLNLTKSGPALEDCSCARDALCLKTKRAIEPCLPRTTSTGCTEARRQCERDQQCSSTMHDYLKHCGKLFSGAVCTNGQQLDTCMCDGTERAICEFVKASMKTLCFDSPPEREESSGWIRTMDPDSDGDDDDPGVDFYQEPESGAVLRAQRCALTLLASILAVLALV
uniref:Growth arrest-specific 1a n=1 Tax=Neogobius melanostomus TaxID=47308 RepID=A0A8C6UM15_9GOBI